MALTPVLDQPGLWRDAAWAPGMPGVYAVIAGVSHYAHLPGGGGAQPPDTFGLDQLFCSANTAASLFEWLRTRFQVDGMPVVWCRLLLAPTNSERDAFQAAGLTHYAPPTYDKLNQAIQGWCAGLPVKPADARASRTLFFFSGHGVKSNWAPQLLPADYLDPSQGAPLLQRCIGTKEMREWMETTPAGEHLALIDACSNDFSPLSSRGATGYGIFPVAAPNGAIPRSAATLVAASPNTVAYQLDGAPHTVFGQAVLEALDGLVQPPAATLVFSSLADYVEPRVNAILRQAGAAVQQSVRPKVDGDRNFIVTKVPAAPAGAVVANAGLEALPVTRSATRGRGSAVRPPPAAPALRSVARSISVGALRGSRAEAHDRFGHEYASRIWEEGGVRVFSLQDGQPLRDDALTLIDVARTDDSSTVHVDVDLPTHEGGVLLVLEGEEFVQRERLGMALPTDSNGTVPVRVTLGIGRAGPGADPKIHGMTARLGRPGADNAHYQYLWELSRIAETHGVAQAAEQADPRRLEKAVQLKMSAESAAIASALLLARAGQLAKVQDWPCNIMTRFPWLPDGAVVWAEALLDAQRRGAFPPHGGKPPAAESLAQLLERGVPFFADALDLADRQARMLLRAADGATARQLRTLSAAIQRIFEVVVPAGDFIVVPGLPRPQWLGPSGKALTAAEMLALLRGGR